jgi:hypothetical protein
MTVTYSPLIEHQGIIACQVTTTAESWHLLKSTATKENINTESFEYYESAIKQKYKEDWGGGWILYTVGP